MTWDREQGSARSQVALQVRSSILQGHPIPLLATIFTLRGMKAWVYLAKLGIIVIMSILRGLLHVQRLSRDANRLGPMPDLISGHELDWLVLEVVLSGKPELWGRFWCITGQSKEIEVAGTASFEPREDSYSDTSETCQIQVDNAHKSYRDLDCCPYCWRYSSSPTMGHPEIQPVISS